MVKISKKTKNNKIILEKLAAAYPDAKPALEFKSAYELLVAVLLSAQCTDQRVNIVTKELGEDAIRGIIKSCGLYKNKAKNIFSLSKILMEKYDGQVPSQREDLESLPGIGRKSANVVMNVCFGIPAIAVDTHVFRVSRRLGLSAGKDVLAVEKDLMAAIPPEDWGSAHHWLIFHGRRVCKAQKPQCDNCPLAEVCPKLI